MKPLKPATIALKIGHKRLSRKKVTHFEEIFVEGFTSSYLGILGKDSVSNLTMDYFLVSKIFSKDIFYSPKKTLEEDEPTPTLMWTHICSDGVVLPGKLRCTLNMNRPFSGYKMACENWDMVGYGWWFRDPANQWIWQVFPIIYRVKYPSQVVVWDFFHQQYQVMKIVSLIGSIPGEFLW